MRSLITRLALFGIVGLAIAGCGSQTGTSLSGLGGGGGPINGTQGGGPAPAGTFPILFIDNGTVNPPTDGYVGFNTIMTDTQSAINAPPYAGPPFPFAPFPEPAEPLPDGGSHDMFIAGSNTTQVILKYTGALPNLVYKFGVQQAQSPFNYTGIVLHANYPAVASLPFPSSVAIELVGNGTAAGPGPLASTYDVRITCNSGQALANPPAFAYMICLLPGGAGTNPGQGSLGYGKAMNTAGPNAIVPGAAGTFTPFNPQFFIVLNYGKATSVGSQGELMLDYIYAFQ